MDALLSEVYDITADRKWMAGGGRSCKQAEMFSLLLMRCRTGGDGGGAGALKGKAIGGSGDIHQRVRKTRTELLLDLRAGD